MNYLAFLLDTTTNTTTTTDPLGGMGFTWIIMIVMLVGMWWFTSRSQKKRDQEAQQMRDSLQVGDEITTIGGIIGKIVSIKEETITIETGHDRTKMRLLKTAVRCVDVHAEDAQD